MILMRIGVIGSLDFGSHSGARTRASRIYSLLSSHHDVTFFNVSTVNTEPVPEGIDGYNLALRPDWLPLTGRELIAGCRTPFVADSHSVDLIWAYNSFQHTPIIGYVTARSLDVPLIVGVNDHRHGQGIKGHLVNNLARRRVLQSANLLVYESATLKRNIAESGVTPERSLIVPTGIDIEEYYLPNISLSEEPSVFYVGRDKDIDLLLDAAELVHEEVPSATVRLAGVSADTYPRYSDRSYIEFLGYVSESQLRREMARAHVTTVPYRDSDTAGRPVKILEYMSAKKCIVATDLPFNTQMLTDQKNAIIIEATPQAFANGLLRGITDPDLRDRLSSQARDDVTDYSLTTMEEKLQQAVQLATQ
jgi:glycosyltransferase involved in cell wall biosynthesis